MTEPENLAPSVHSRQSRIYNWVTACESKLVAQTVSIGAVAELILSGLLAPDVAGILSTIAPTALRWRAAAASTAGRRCG